MRLRKQGTSTYPIPLYMVSSSDHITPQNAVTPTVTIRKNGGASGPALGTIVASGTDGVAYFNGHVGDRDTLGSLVITATGTGCDPYTVEYTVVPFDPFNATNLGISNLDAAVTSRMATFVYTAPDNAGIAAIGSAVNAIGLIVVAIQGQTDQFVFDGTDVKATLDGEIVVASSVSGNVGGSVGSISGVTFPANFGLLQINGSGIIQVDVSGLDESSLALESTVQKILLVTQSIAGRGRT